MLGILSYLLSQAEIETEREARAKEKRSLGNQLGTSLFDASNAMVLYAHTRNEAYAKQFRTLKSRHAEVYDELNSIIKDDHQLTTVLSELKKISLEGFALLNSVVEKIDRGDDVSNSVVEQISIQREVQRLINRFGVGMKKFRQRLYTTESIRPSDSEPWKNRLDMFLPLAAAANVLIGILLAASYASGITRRIGTLERNSIFLSRNEPLLPAITGSDEIAWLDRAFHEMADSLSEGARREKILINNAPDIVCSIDRQGCLVAINPACYNLWGYLQEELVGRSIDDIVHPEDRPFLDRDRSDSNSLTQSFSIENRIYCQSGAIEQMMWSVRWSNQQSVFVCLAHSITDRKVAQELMQLSESRFRAIVESMPAMHFIVSANGIIKTANNTLLKVFGYDYAEVLQKHLVELFPSASELDLSNLSSEVATQKSVELTAVKRDGSEFPVELLASEVTFSNNRHYSVTVLDISERHRLELLKQQFVHLVGNNLKEPVSDLRLVLTGLRDGEISELNSKGEKLVIQAERETYRLESLMGVLLDAQKFRTGKLSLNLGIHSLETLAERSVAAVQALAEKNALSFDCRMEELQIVCDESRMIQVLVNLLSNAIKFSPKGGTITIRSNKSDDWVQIGVSNHGRSIPESFRQKIFEQFVQVEDSDAKIQGGVGLGLAICRGIIDQHGGRIHVDSGDGINTFWLSLPSDPERKNQD